MKIAAALLVILLIAVLPGQASSYTISHSTPHPFILVEWNDDSTSVWIASKKELSNVVLMDCLGTHDQHNELDGQSSGQFQHLSDLSVTTVWVLSGDNPSGDGPDYGERFHNPDHDETCGVACEFTDGCDPMPRRGKS